MDLTLESEISEDDHYQDVEVKDEKDEIPTTADTPVHHRPKIDPTFSVFPTPDAAPIRIVRAPHPKFRTLASRLEHTARLFQSEATSSIMAEIWNMDRATTNVHTSVTSIGVDSTPAMTSLTPPVVPRIPHLSTDSGPVTTRQIMGPFPWVTIPVARLQPCNRKKTDALRRERQLGTVRESTSTLLSSFFFYCTSNDLEITGDSTIAQLLLRDTAYAVTPTTSKPAASHIPPDIDQVHFQVTKIFNRYSVTRGMIPTVFLEIIREINACGLLPAQQPVTLEVDGWIFPTEGLSPSKSSMAIHDLPEMDALAEAELNCETRQTSQEYVLTSVSAGYATAIVMQALADLRDLIEEPSTGAVTIFEQTTDVMESIFAMIAHTDQQPVGHFKEVFAKQILRWLIASDTDDYISIPLLTSFFDRPRSQSLAPPKTIAQTAVYIRKRAISLLAVLWTTDAYTNTYMSNPSNLKNVFQDLVIRFTQHWEVYNNLPTVPSATTIASAEEQQQYYGIYGAVLSSQYVTVPTVNTGSLMRHYITGISYVQELAKLQLFDGELLHLHHLPKHRPPLHNDLQGRPEDIDGNLTALIAHLLHHVRDISSESGAVLPSIKTCRHDITIGHRANIDDTHYWERCSNGLERIAFIIELHLDLQLHTPKTLPRKLLSMYRDTRD